MKTQFSLQDVANITPQKGTIVVEKAESKINEPDVELTEEYVLTTLTQFAQKKLDAGNRQLYATLTSSKIIFNTPTIIIELNNEVQKEMLTSIKQDMLDEIRLMLKNKQAQLEIKVSSAVENLKAYKPMDKFKLMSEKNPMLLELKKRFDLEVEY